ncbi:H(+)/Cl(-) exchange transporter ClcA [Moorella thermoacetica]|uniref:H(+)/Cl(-) exchange transporter ClcA n=1 Tax=Neomoorella thermoacetica TaxID=1525 RepID=A0A1J5JEE9_NEOTH|nr:H(+)/Cl(-) exchange transporter ClcA [Moorella thermoacetica]OIQ07906.1 H(+)/Cl(-) exchange transporter ClcA [Moorella thermoacetica]
MARVETVLQEHSVPEGILLRRYSYLLRFLCKGALAGAGAGLVGAAFRLALTEGDLWRNSLLTWARGIPLWGWLALPFLGALTGGLAGWLTSLAPETAGSGIPHVEAVLINLRRLVWWRVIPVKFIAGALAIGAGLSLGPEGPAVQMGAAAGKAVSDGFGRSKTEELHLIACGAGAGLAAAFNAPLAGVVFVLEELRRNFSPYALGGALVASVVADMVSRHILGPLPTFRLIEAWPVLPLTTLPVFLVLGVLAGILGAVFNWSLLASLELGDRLSGFPRWLRAMLILFLAGILGYFLPEVLGGGHLLAEEALAGRVAWTLIPLLFVVKFLLTMISNSAGVPGGIFLPLLVLGALLGSLVGQVSGLLIPAFQGMVPAFAMIGMAAYFVAILRLPLTGVVLIIEMTGSYRHIVLLLFTCMIAYLVVETLGSRPAYEMLLERDLARARVEAEPSPVGKMLIMDFAVEAGSDACGRLVRDLELPPDCLLVTIRRKGREIIPRGNTSIQEGDHLAVITPEERAAEICHELSGVTRCKFQQKLQRF